MDRLRMSNGLLFTAQGPLIATIRGDMENLFRKIAPHSWITFSRNAQFMSSGADPIGANLWTNATIFIKVLLIGYADAGWEALACLPVTFTECKKL